MRIDFHASAGPTIGVEVELQLVDRETRQLRSAASELLPVLDDPKIKHELLESTVELNTGICTTVAEARGDLETTLASLRAEADRRGIGLLCAGTHPTSNWA